MPGETFLPGQSKVRPGIYIRTTNTGIPPAAAVPQGIVAVLFAASWGPLATVQTLEGGVEEVESVYQSGGTIDTAKEVFRGNALRVLAYRLGTGGAKSTVNLNDGAATPVDIVKVDAKYVGTVGNQLKVTVRDSLTEAGKREILVYQDTALREQFIYTAGADEAQAFVDAVANSDWIAASKLAAGDGSLANVTTQSLTGGTDPTASGTEYSAGLAAIEPLVFNVIVTDSVDTSIHATIQAYVDRVRSEGKRVLGVVGEPTSVALATRLTNSAAFNSESMHYVGNGFTSANGDLEGYKAAARIAGMIASGAITDSLTHAVVTGGTDLIGALTNAEIVQAIQSGMLVFTFNAQRQIQIEYGINTLVTPAADQDAGWKKIRRVRTRDYLMDSIARTWDPLVGRINNSPDGRATLIAAAQGIINDMIAIGALLDGTIVEDPANPASGDSAWFVVNVDDVDSAEKLYLTFGFRFSPAA